MKPARVKPPKVIVVLPSLETKAAAEVLNVEKVTPVEQRASVGAVVVMAKEKKRPKRRSLIRLCKSSLL